MWILTSASHMSSACASVLTAMNSTPERPASTIRLTAFVPPPPTPTTLITARKLPDWSLTLKFARPEAVVERAPSPPRLTRGGYASSTAVSTRTDAANPRPRPSTRGLLLRHRPLRNADVEIARPAEQRHDPAGDRKLEREVRRVAEAQLEARREDERHP